MGLKNRLVPFRILGPLTGGFVWVLTVDGKAPFDIIPHFYYVVS